MTPASRDSIIVTQVADGTMQTSTVLTEKGKKMAEYKEIHCLYFYCLKIGLKVEISELFDGYKLSFPNGGDFVQHYGSYGSAVGCVEPAIGSRLDYTAVSLTSAKSLVKRHRERLSKK